MSLGTKPNSPTRGPIRAGNEGLAPIPADEARPLKGHQEAVAGWSQQGNNPNKPATPTGKLSSGEAGNKGGVEENDGA